MGLCPFPTTPGTSGPPKPGSGPVIGLFPAPTDRVGRDPGRRSNDADPTGPSSAASTLSHNRRWNSEVPPFIPDRAPK